MKCSGSKRNRTAAAWRTGEGSAEYVRPKLGSNRFRNFSSKWGWRGEKWIAWNKKTYGPLKVHGYVLEVVRMWGSRSLECAWRTWKQKRKPGEVNWGQEVKRSVAKLHCSNFTPWAQEASRCFCREKAWLALFSVRSSVEKNVIRGTDYGQSCYNNSPKKICWRPILSQ